MKELTIEEKLEKAKMLYKDANADQRYVLESLFPELTEIEDVRIRKRIIQALHGDVLDMEETTKAIAWLEKQGEHANFRNKIQIGDKVTRSEDGMLVNLSQLKRVAKPADKIEQKIADWSKEDERIYYSLLTDIKTRQNSSTSTLEAYYNEQIEWLKSLKDRVQPKQEWNEENSPYYDDICEILINLLHSETANINKNAVQKDLDWLKSIKPQPKNEWSEEDEKMLEHAIDMIEWYSVVDKNKKSRRVSDWLKSLKPQKQWKPSKEQMEALWNVYEGGEKQSALASLYNDLKKL